MIIKKQKYAVNEHANNSKSFEKIGEFFVAKLGKLVGETEKEGIKNGLTKKQVKKIIKTTFSILSDKVNKTL